MVSINETLLDAQLAQLEEASNWSPRVISKFESFIRTADDYDIFRVNPIQYAAEKGMAEQEAIDLFLHAAKLGLFDLEWNLICACCGQVFNSLRSIGKVHTDFVCNICQMENHLQLDDLIEVTFTVALSIRDNVFRHPDKLSVEDYVYRYRLSRGIQLEPNLGANADYIRKSMRVLTYLDAGESITLTAEITPGLVHGGDLLHGSVFCFVAESSDDNELPPVHVRFGLPVMQVIEPQTSPYVMTLPGVHGESVLHLTHFAQIPAGRLKWIFENQLAERVCVWLMDLPENILSSWLKMPPFLSGKRLLTSQTFRNLYRSEVIDANEGLGIREITFLFTDLKGSTALYDKVGDLRAFHLVRQHFDALNSVIVKNSGVIVKTIGDAVMAAFCSPREGLQAALEIFRAIDKFNEGRTEQLILKIGLHTGHSIAVTLNERIDYFGQTVNIASRVQQLAEANEIYISHDVYTHDGVSALLESCNVTPVQADVRGLTGKFQLYKITLR